MKKTKSLYHGHRFPATVISHAVRWYRFVTDDDTALEQQFFNITKAELEPEESRQGCSPPTMATWHLDEVFVTLRGEPYLLWRAVDQRGAELDIPLQKRRDKTAAKRLFICLLATCPDAPRRIVTDQLRSYPAAKAEIPELANVKHVFVKASARANNRDENNHQPTRERERRMRGFRGLIAHKRSCRASYRFASTSRSIDISCVRPLYRKQLAARFDAWHRITGLTQDPSDF